MLTTPSRVAICAFALLLALAGSDPGSSAAQTRITSPQQQFGFEIGADYQLADYTQLADYWRKLDAESDRMIVQEIGKTSEGRPHLMAIVTSPENHRNLARSFGMVASAVIRPTWVRYSAGTSCGPGA